MCNLKSPCTPPLRIYHQTGGHTVLACMNGHHFILGEPPPPPIEPGRSHKGKSWRKVIK